MNKRGFKSVVKFSSVLLLIVALYVAFHRYGLVYINKIIAGVYGNNAGKGLGFLVTLIATFSLTYIFLKLTNNIIKGYLIRKGTRGEVKLLLSVYRRAIWGLVVFVTFSLLFKQIGSLITSIGLIGFGITIALQKPILNFIGWITVVFGKAYRIGDVISINNINGRVYEVKVMCTNLSELDSDDDPTGKSVSVPNEVVLTTPIINRTRGTSYVWSNLNVYITYPSNWKKALKTVEEVVQGYYDKNIKDEIKMLKRDLGEYEKVIVSFHIYDKGIRIKARYLVDFNRENVIKTEISKELMGKLQIAGIVLGKVENVSTL